MVEDWLFTFPEILSPDQLKVTAARQAADFISRYGRGIVHLVEIRFGNDCELLVVEIQTGAPQRPFYPILSKERIGLLFRGVEEGPHVVMLRGDFPNTEHQQLVPEGFPLAICIDDRPWAEARLAWTPSELIERITSWFRKAARGELHDARQPLDPLWMGSNLGFFIARSVLNTGSTQDLVAIYGQNDRTVLTVEPLKSGSYPAGSEPLSVVAYKVKPEAMRRLTFAPTTVASLTRMLQARDVDLVADLKLLLTRWLAEKNAWRLNGRVVIIVEFPIVSPPPRNELQAGTDHRAFISNVSAGDIAVTLGIAERSSGFGKVGYVPTIGRRPIDQAAMEVLPIQNAEVYLTFDPDLGGRLVGRAGSDERRVTLFGAGAIGSHVADCLAREGRFQWTIVDGDRVLPHNLARHITFTEHIGKTKAEIVAKHINDLYSGTTRAAAVTGFISSAEQEDGLINTAMAQSDIIIDATASVVAGRAISDAPCNARRVSCFFNPTGNAAVLLVEPVDRSITLRDIEAQYLRLVITSESLVHHLMESETFAYTGACRALTNRIPQSHAAILSGLVSARLSKSLDERCTGIAIWTIEDDGSVRHHKADAEPIERYRAQGWTVTASTGLICRVRALRDRHLPNETGGILLGLVDIPAKSIHLIEALAEPGDSQGSVTGFVRGVEDVDSILESVHKRSAGQVRYVGEWHSHPRRVSARPSAVDCNQLDWLAVLMGIDSMPALMLIVADGETVIIFADQPTDRVVDDLKAGTA